jgi:predicted nucleotidyltransferase
MITRQSIQRHRDAIIKIAERHGASNVRVFGSVARGDTTESSDLDLIVRFEPGRTLFDQGELLMDLRELLGIDVDIISEGSINGRFGQIIAREAIPL